MVSPDPDPPVRVMALHSLTYCERLYYLEEVEGARVADDAVYGGRELHETRARPDPDARERRSLELTSEQLGLTGVADMVRTRDGVPVPYEYKRGRARRAKSGEAEAWDSDAVQVAAYAMLLEEAEGNEIPEGRIHYGAEKTTVRVPITKELREQVTTGIARARALRESTERPPLTDQERKCVRCSLAPICLPEEERALRQPGRGAQRLFPEDEERQVLHVTTPGASVRRAGEQLVVRSPDEDEERFPSRAIAAVVLHGGAQITSQALQFCAWHEIAVHWVNASGRYVAGLAPGAGVVQRRLRQYAALTDPGRSLSLAQSLAKARIASQLRYLLRATRQAPATRAAVEPAVATIREQLSGLERATRLSSVRGHEGAAGRAYFGALPNLVLPECRAWAGPAGRTRRPPRDPFNALLSFEYALLYGRVMQAVLAVGLDPAIGFFHTPRSAAHPLVLDLMELFRVPLCDMPVVYSLNRTQWREDDFALTPAKVWLSDTGRPKAIGLFEQRLLDRWKHPVLNYSLSYARTIELEVRLLEKEWTGSPGLFAQSRLR